MIIVETLKKDPGNSQQGLQQRKLRVQSLKDSLMKIAFGKQRETKSKEIPYRI